MGTQRRKGRNSFAFLCGFANWRFLIAPELTLEALESLAPPPVDVAFLSRIDSSSIPRLREKLALKAIVCERNTGDTTGVAREGSQIPVFCLTVDGATTLVARGDRLELRTFRGAQLTLTSRSR